MSSSQQISTVQYVVDNTKRRTATPTRTEQNLFVRIGKSESKVTNNKRLTSALVELTQTHHSHSK